MPEGSLYQQYAYFYQRAGALYSRPAIRASLEIILSVFTVTLLIFFAIRPTLSNVASLQKKIEDQTVVLTKANNKVSQLLKAETALSDNRDRLQLLTNAVPEDFNYFNIVKRLEIIANESGAQLTTDRLPGSIILGGPNVPKLVGDTAKGIVMPNKNNVLIIGVQFSVQGDQNSVLSFTKSLENMDMLAVLHQVKLSKTTTPGKSGLILDGSAWFYSHKSETASQ